MSKLCFFALGAFLVSFSEFSYYLPIDICDNNMILCYHVTDTNVELIVAENVESIFKSNTLFFSAIPFFQFPVQPVLFFDKKGFSYFDQGILKSKFFAFRSPGSIYTLIPFDHTMGIHWYSQSRGVVSILRNNFYVIYDLSRDNGEMVLMIDDGKQKTHSLFPFLFKNSIFYVSESLSGSKVVMRDSKGCKTILLETEGKRIFNFRFFDQTSGIFGVYNRKDLLVRSISFDFYLFYYSYEEASFKYEHCFSTNISCTTLNVLSNKTLFPWCFQPARLNGVLYGIVYTEDSFQLQQIDSKTVDWITLKADFL